MPTPRTRLTRTVELDLTTSRVDEDHYEITGTFGLEGEAPARIDGTVSGGCAERYLAVATPSALSSARSDLSPVSLPASATRAASSDRPPAAHRSAARPPRARLGVVLAALTLALALSACGGEGATEGGGAPDGDAARWDAARWDEATWR